jgi:hypothetical protein
VFTKLDWLRALGKVALSSVTCSGLTVAPLTAPVNWTVPVLESSLTKTMFCSRMFLKLGVRAPLVVS